MQLRTKALIVVTVVIALLLLIMYAAVQVVIVDGSGDLQVRVLLFLAFTAVVGLAIAYATVFLIEKIGIALMDDMTGAMRNIRTNRDLSARVPVGGHDEVSQFAIAVNETLDALQTSRQQLSESEVKYRSLVESINDIVWETDSDLRYTYVSPKVREVLGYEPDEVMGKTPFDLMDAGDRGRTGPAITDMINRKGSFELVEFSMNRRDGSLADLEISGLPVRDHAGKTTGFRGIARDVGERKRTGEALKKAYDDLEHRVQQRTAELKEANKALTENESKYRDLVQNANSMIIRFDMEGRITYFNEFACTFFGYSHDEIIGASVLETIVPREESSGRNLWKHMEDLMERPDQYSINVNQNVRRNGERVWVSWTNKAVIGQDGRVEDILAIGNDVTDLKHASDALKRVNDTLEFRVQQRTAELASAVKALQAEITERRKVEAQMQSSLQEKEVLLKEIHHRVKNNLQIISSLLSLQSESISAENPARAFRESQDRIRSMALIHEKLYRARDISRVDFGEYVSSLTAYLSRSYMAGRGVEIAIGIEGIYLDIDKAIPCGLIINELVSNSLKYAFRDGQGSRIHISLSHSDNAYTLIVGDDGAGMPQGLDFRNTTSLGLQLVNTLVGQLEGTIDLEESTGVTFMITFPDKGKK
ncbi:MAG: PAS domain S-box protein [Methanocella sp.]